MKKLSPSFFLRSVLIRKDIAEKIDGIENDLSQISGTFEIGHLRKKFLSLVIAAGLKLGAGDIHIEPEENTVKIRYRIDGILQDAAQIPMNEYPHLLGNIKILSGFKATDVETGVKDSRFSIKLDRRRSPEIKRPGN